MAKKNSTAPKTAAALMGAAFLTELAKQTAASVTNFMTTAEQRASIDATFTMTNPAVTGPNGELATIASPAGMAAAGVSGATAKPKLTVLSDIVLPEPKRGNFGGNKRESAYDFDSLGVNQGWYIPANDDQPNPAKSLASTVSSASKKYSKEIPGQTVDRNRKVVNEAGDPVLDANGKVQFTVEKVPARAYERKFEIRKIEDGTPYGHPGTTGALIARVK